MVRAVDFRGTELGKEYNFSNDQEVLMKLRVCDEISSRFCWQSLNASLSFAGKLPKGECEDPLCVHSNYPRFG